MNELPSGLHVLCPDRKVRKVTQMQVTPQTAGMSTLGLVPCAIRLSGFHVKGWRDRDGHFVPHSASEGFRKLVELGGVGPEWSAAALDDIQMHIMAQRVWARQHDEEPICISPFPASEWYKDTPDNRLDWNAKHLAVQVEPGIFVHAVLLNPEMNVIRPVPDCPNAGLWDSEAGYAQVRKPLQA